MIGLRDLSSAGGAVAPDFALDWKDHSLHHAEQIARSVCGPFKLRFLTPQRDLSLSAYKVGRCQWIHVVGAPTALATPPGDVQSEHEESIKVFLLATGALWRQGDATELVEPGALMIHHRTEPYTLTSYGPTNQIVVHIPRRILPPRLGTLLRQPTIFVAGVPGLSRILGAFIRSAHLELSSLEGTGRACVASSLTQLVADLLSESEVHGATDQGMDTLRRRIKAYVSAHSADSALCISAIARQMGCSQRYLYTAFQNQSESLERYILNTRLDRARSRLLAAASERVSIRDVAESSGFSAYAHFSRAFKARFGISPQQCIPGRGRRGLTDTH